MTRLAPRRKPLLVVAGALAALATAVALLVPHGAAPETGERAGLAAARAANPVTPGNFTGYGFDQCLAPEQWKMDRWLTHSPFLAVGIYISGNSRACRSQPNLTPTWVATQLAKGWRLLPITLGPQSTCVGRYPKYGASIDPTISNNATDGYAAARRQGRAEGLSSVAAASALGIVPGSTLWYDLEGWSDYRITKCRESALAFLSGWVSRVRERGYVAGVYSSAGSGIKILDDARAQRRTDVTLPDRIWIARWDLVPNTSTSYIREDGWRPGNRMKQYQGGHDESWGKVTINIDRNWVDLGATVAPAERHCNGMRVDQPAYADVRMRGATYTPPAMMVKILKCFLKEQGRWDGRLGPRYGKGIRTVVAQWHAARGLTPHYHVDGSDWVALLSAGTRPPTKRGSAGEAVRRVQRALTAAGLKVGVTGVFDGATESAVRSYQRRLRLRAYGVVTPQTWRALQAGRR